MSWRDFLSYIRPEDYKELTPLFKSKDQTIRLDWIADQWDELGRFYAYYCFDGNKAAECSQQEESFCTSKSRARKNIKDRVYFSYMSDKAFRKKTHRGVLKTEEFHGLEILQRFLLQVLYDEDVLQAFLHQRDNFRYVHSQKTLNR